jgi:putative NADH dehydrogenase/NAD(P)H nitroreductase
MCAMLPERITPKTDSSWLMESFHNLLLNRRSIRKYTPQSLDPDAVRLILEAGLTAPTSKNQRSWQFVVVEDRDMLARLGECKASYATSITKAPLAIVVVADTTKSDAWIEDASVAAIIMQLQAADLGLGSCWVEVRDRFRPDDEPSEDYVRSLLGIPEKFGVLCILSFGYKDEERRPIDPSRLLWEKVHVGQWNPAGN